MGSGVSRIIGPWNAAAIADLAVLIVDDNATNRRALTNLLENWGACTTAVSSAADALRELRSSVATERPYSLILLEAMMPEMDGFTLVEQIHLESDLVGPAIVMLTSADGQGDPARCRQLGLTAYLVKPVKSAELKRAITASLEATPAPRCDSPLQPVLAPDGALGRKLRILLAEDNLVNQRVAVRMLQKHGHSVEIACNGALARTALAGGTFDLVLMDVQMPVMGGFEATTAIRGGEVSGGGRIPIIAMTAHAMKEDRERCLEAGMDDYVAKPIQIAELLRTLDRVLGAAIIGGISLKCGQTS